MGTLAVYALLVFGLVGLGCGLYVLAVVHRERADRSFSVRAFPLWAFWLLEGSLALVAFALPAVRLWVVYAIAFLFIARPVASWIAERVLDRRARAGKTL